jgi:hypothetical protein
VISISFFVKGLGGAPTGGAGKKKERPHPPRGVPPPRAFDANAECTSWLAVDAKMPAPAQHAVIATVAPSRRKARPVVTGYIRLWPFWGEAAHMKGV